MTTEEKIERLTSIVDTLASSVVAHDNQIEALIKIAERHEAGMRELREDIQSMTRQWQAYINTLPRT